MPPKHPDFAGFLRRFPWHSSRVAFDSSIPRPGRCPAAGHRLETGHWEISALGFHDDLTLTNDGQYFRTDNANSWATEIWKSTNGVLTLTSKDGSKDEQNDIGRPKDLTVLFNDDVVFVAKAQHNQGEEYEKDYFITFHKVK